LIDADGGDTTYMALKEQFIEPWKTYFNGDELPIADNRKPTCFSRKNAFLNISCGINAYFQLKQGTTGRENRKRFLFETPFRQTKISMEW